MNDVFKQNPNLEKYFSTSDGEAFYNENDAKNHAKKLEVKSVETVYNDSFLEANDFNELSAEEIEMAEFEKSEAAAKLEVVTNEANDLDTKVSKTADATITEGVDAKIAEATKTADVVSTDAKVTEAPKTDLSKMNKATLIAFAKENALELDESLTNKEMVEALTKQLEAKK